MFLDPSIISIYTGLWFGFLDISIGLITGTFILFTLLSIDFPVVFIVGIVS